jgi:hypothetical protein
MIYAIVMAVLLNLNLSFAGPKGTSPGNEAKKVIRFDEEIVDGMDKARLDSLMSKVNRRDGSGDHLYRVRKNFRRENQQVIKEFIFTP